MHKQKFVYKRIQVRTKNKWWFSYLIVNIDGNQKTRQITTYVCLVLNDCCLEHQVAKDAQSTRYKQKFEIKLSSSLAAALDTTDSHTAVFLSGPARTLLSTSAAASRPTDANARPCSLLPKWLSTHWRTVGSNGWNPPKMKFKIMYSWNWLIQGRI